MPFTLELVSSDGAIATLREGSLVHVEKYGRRKIDKRGRIDVRSSSSHGTIVVLELGMVRRRNKVEKRVGRIRGDSRSQLAMAVLPIGFFSRNEGEGEK